MAYVIKVNNNSDFCGKGAGGVQFANGEARTDSARMAAWFKEHPGYTVTEEGGAGSKSIDAMTVAELKTYAEANGIDLGEAKTKAEILAAIKETE